MTYEHRRMKTRDLHVLRFGPYLDPKRRFFTSWTLVEPAFHVGNPRASSRTRATASALRKPVQNMLLREVLKIAPIGAGLERGHIALWAAGGGGRCGRSAERHDARLWQQVGRFPQRKGRPPQLCGIMSTLEPTLRIQDHPGYLAGHSNTVVQGDAFWLHDQSADLDAVARNRTVFDRDFNLARTGANRFFNGQMGFDLRMDNQHVSRVQATLIHCKQCTYLSILHSIARKTPIWEIKIDRKWRFGNPAARQNPKRTEAAQIKICSLSWRSTTPVRCHTPILTGRTSVAKWKWSATLVANAISISATRHYRSYRGWRCATRR